MNCAFLPCLATRLLRRAAWAVVASLVAFVSSALAQPHAPYAFQVADWTPSSLLLNWGDFSGDESGFEIQRSSDRVNFAVVGVVGPNVTTFTDETVSADTSYWYRLRAIGAGSPPTYSDYVTAKGRTTFPTPPPSGWSGRDVGNPAPAGSESALPPALTMRAGGTDIFGTADAFRYHFQTANQGNITVIARVDSMTNTNSWAKAGVMIRSSLKADSVNAAMLLTAANVCTFQARVFGGEETSHTSGGWLGAPYWVKLQRAGSTFRGYISPDGTNWTLVGAQDIAMPEQVYVGIAGCSHNPGAQTVIAFSNVSVATTPYPPFAASHLQGIVTGDHSIRITWRDNSGTETGFKIYMERNRRHSPNPSLVAVVPANTTSWEATGLTADSEYSFHVKAERDGQEAPSWEPYIDVFLPQAADVPPPAPYDIEVTRSAANTLQVRWPDASTTETGFEIERAVTSDGVFALVGTVGANVSTFSDAGLTALRSYTYRVRAVNNAGYSAYSPTETGVPVAAPTAPADLRIAAFSETTLHLSWTDTSNNESGFELTRATGGGAFDVIARLAADTTSYVDTGLTPGTTYTYRLQAFNEYSDGYAEVTRSTSGGPPPAADWTGRDIGDVGVAGSVTGAPPAVTMKAGGADIFGRADSFHSLLQAATGDTTIVARVASMTNTHPWAKAGVMIRASLDANAANAAMLLTAGNVSVFQARTFAGQDTLSTSGAWVRAPYWVKLTRTGNTFRGYLSPDGTNWTLVGTQDCTLPRQVYVGVVGSSHNVATLTDLAFTNIDVVTESPGLAAPSNFRAINVSAYGALLMWTDNSSNEDGFRIWYDRNDEGSHGLDILATTGPNVTYLPVSLAPDAAHIFLLQAIRGSETADGGWIEVFTPQPDPSPPYPSAPTNLAITGQTDTTIGLSWTDTSGDETGFIIIRTTVNDGRGLFIPVPANTTTYTDTGLTPGGTYTYQIAAQGTEANSGFSTEIVATTTRYSSPPPANWTAFHIGGAGASGSVWGLPPTVNMHAGGDDIFGTFDNFHGLIQAATGDVVLVARVASMTNSHPWAKAGVMIRASLDAHAPNAAMLLTAGNVCVFQARTTLGGTTTSTSGGYFGAPYWVKVTRVGNTFTGYISADGATWRLVGAQDIAMPAQVDIGVVGSSHNVGAQSLIAFEQVSLTGGATTPPPEPVTWTRVSWNAASSSATPNASGDAMEIKGMSQDIWGRSDGGTFMYQPVTGDDMLKTRVDSVTMADPYSKAGLMFRATLDSYSANVGVVVTSDRGIFFHVRKSAGDVTTVVREVPGVRAPVKLWLGRTGNQFLASYSVDNGVTWIPLGEVTVAMPANAYLGPVATSHNNAVESTASFSQITP